ncbi:MBL fold metallo-hydrolase [Okibacterium endophyticum]
MHLTPLGCLAGMPAGGLASSGYLVDDDETTLLLDAGPGTALALSRQLPAAGLSAVFVSHRHTDHIFDLLPIGKMVLSSRLDRDERTGELTVAGDVPPVPLLVPEGTLALLQTLAALFPVATHPLLDRAFELAFDVREYRPGESVTFGGLSLRWELLRHTAPNCGIRVENDEASLVYTGDTGVTPALTALASGAGTLLSESSLRETDTSEHGHLSSADAGRLAAEAGVAELVLTHFSSPDPAEHDWHRDRAAEQFDGPVSVAVPHRPTPIASTRKALA